MKIMSLDNIVVIILVLIVIGILLYQLYSNGYLSFIFGKKLPSDQEVQQLMDDANLIKDQNISEAKETNKEIDLMVKKGTEKLRNGESLTEGFRRFGNRRRVVV